MVAKCTWECTSIQPISSILALQIPYAMRMGPLVFGAVNTDGVAQSRHPSQPGTMAALPSFGDFVSGVASWRHEPEVRWPSEK